MLDSELETPVKDMDFASPQRTETIASEDQRTKTRSSVSKVSTNKQFLMRKASITR